MQWYTPYSYANGEFILEYFSKQKFNRYLNPYPYPYPYPHLLILLSLNLIFSLHYLQQLYPKILALILHHICFSFLSNNREYFSKQKYNRYFNPYPYYFINFIRSATT